MKPKSGKPPAPAPPVAPAMAEDADVADPGEVSQVKEEQIERGEGKYGAAHSEPHKPSGPEEGAATDESAEEKKMGWIEIELVGEDDEPIPGVGYRIELPDGKTAEGSLDESGWARVSNVAEGKCKMTFAGLDQECWEFIESLGPR